MTRKKLLSLFFVTLALALVSIPVFAQVNEPEIRSVAGDTVEFINYKAPVQRKAANLVITSTSCCVLCVLNRLNLLRSLLLITFCR